MKNSTTVTTTVPCNLLCQPQIWPYQMAFYWGGYPQMPPRYTTLYEKPNWFQHVNSDHVQSLPIISQSDLTLPKGKLEFSYLLWLEPDQSSLLISYQVPTRPQVPARCNLARLTHDSTSILQSKQYSHFGHGCHASWRLNLACSYWVYTCLEQSDYVIDFKSHPTQL